MPYGYFLIQFYFTKFYFMILIQLSIFVEVKVDITLQKKYNTIELRYFDTNKLLFHYKIIFYYKISVIEQIFFNNGVKRIFPKTILMSGNSKLFLIIHIIIFFIYFLAPFIAKHITNIRKMVIHHEFLSSHGYFKYMYQN